MSELNVIDAVRFDSDESAYCKPTLELNFGRMGKKLRGDLGKVQAALAALSSDEARAVADAGEVTLEGHTLVIADGDLVVTQGEVYFIFYILYRYRYVSCESCSQFIF